MWRYANVECTLVTNDAGTFAPAEAATIAAFLAEGGVIAPYRRWADLAQAKTELAAEAEARAKKVRVAVAGTEDATKLAIYREKYATAVAAIDNDASALAALKPEADARGESAAALAGLVKLLGDQWRSAGLAIDAACQAHKAAIAALDSAEAAENYDLEAGWPG